MLLEPWNTILFFVIIAILTQFYKLWKGKGGKTPSKLFLQILTFVLSGIFVFFNGGFVGLIWPIFPAWSGDFVGFLGGIIVFAGDLIAVIGLAFGAMMALYEGLLKRIFEIVGFAAKEKAAARKSSGFWT